jgi:hypothetical protein
MKKLNAFKPNQVMKKHIYKTMLIFLVMSVMPSCEKDYDTPEANQFSDAVAVASGNKRIERGNVSSFADLSKGVTSRSWTIPASATITNMNGQTSDFINLGSAKKYSGTNLDLIHVRFDEPGNHEVNLKADFEVDSIMLDTTFNVTILDHIQTKLEILSIDSGFSEIKPDQITMYEGGTINFKDASLGTPNRRKWTLPGGEPSSAGGINIDKDELVKNISVSYPTIGTYDLTLVSWRQYPMGVKDTLHLKDYVNVVENIDPPSIKNISENESGVIHLIYDLPLKLTSDIVSNLALTVDGTAASIASATLNADDNRIVDITPSVNILNNQSAKLSYDGNGGLMRINDIMAPAFTDQIINLFLPQNLAGDEVFGFEDGGAGWSPPWAWDSKGTTSFPDDFAASGTYSLRMEVNTDAKVRAYSKKNVSKGKLTGEFNLEAGQNITLEYKVWIDPSFTSPGLQVELFRSSKWGASVGFYSDVSSLPRGEWVTISLQGVKSWEVSHTEGYWMSIRYGTKGVIYIDDIKVYEPQ